MNDFLQNPNNGQKNKRVPRTRRVFDSSHPYNSNSKFHSGKYQGARSGNVQRPGSGRQNFQNGSRESVSTISAEMLNTIVSLVRTMTINQELLLDAQERRVAAEERKADALENIAEYFSSLSAQDDLQTEDGMMGMDESFREEGEKSSAEFCHTESCHTESCHVDDAIDFCSESEPDASQIKRRETASCRIPDTEKKEKSSDIPSVAARDKKILSREEAMEVIYRMRDQGATFNQIAEYFIENGQPTFSGKGKWHAQTIHRLLQKQKQ